ncbi:MAG: replication initiator [Trebonia sp.]
MNVTHAHAIEPDHAERCTRPVRLFGRVDYLDSATGEILHRYTTEHEPGGVLRVPCKTRRASRCQYCAEIYRADTYQLIRAGLTGGKGVPATVAAHPCLFVTRTAPSFGAVHARREKDGRVLLRRPRRDGGTCPHGRPVACAERHNADDPRIGTPVCVDCYDYTESVLFNAMAPELWRRFAECLLIGQVPDLKQLGTARWAHMLGFRGHFSTKSRAYSTTLGALRAARAEHNRAEHADQLPAGDTVLVVADWHFAGLGHLDDLAATAAELRQLDVAPKRGAT